ncbi:hypothetical protein ACFLWS_06640 [Chloroflexota bacterium]
MTWFQRYIYVENTVQASAIPTFDDSSIIRHLVFILPRLGHYSSQLGYPGSASVAI